MTVPVVLYAIDVRLKRGDKVYRKFCDEIEKFHEDPQKVANR